MKNSMKCPKCQSADILRIPGLLERGGNNIAVGITFFNGVKGTRYLCASCGFIENWVESADDIQRVKKKYAS